MTRPPHRKRKDVGAAIARQLAAEGAAVVVNYASSQSDAERVAAEITRNGGRAIAVQANVAKQADVDRLFAETKKAFGRLDILVNNSATKAAVDAVTRSLAKELGARNIRVNAINPGTVERRKACTPPA
jgi:3-oxoacyl-[acyl-carrier protein] reductase